MKTLSNEMWWVSLIYKTQRFRIEFQCKILFLILIFILILEKKWRKKFTVQTFMSIFKI